MIEQLRGGSFTLLSNDGGHAATDTVMRFDSDSDHLTGHYAGANVRAGHCYVIGVDEQEAAMLYQAVTADGTLQAGRARVAVEQRGETLHMILDWSWLTGDGAGRSLWRRTD